MSDGLELLGMTSGVGVGAGAGAVGLYWIAAPTFKAVGNAFGEWTSERMRNVLRIGERVNNRLGGQDPDDGLTVPARVLFEVLNEGSWISDEVQQEYLAGLLLASRAPLGVGDDGAYFARQVTGMTANQIRLHHAFYDAIIRGAPRFDLGISAVRTEHAVWAPLDAAIGVIAPEGQDTLEVAVSSAALALDQLKLIDTIAIGDASLLNTMVVNGDIGRSAVVATGLIPGAALFIWAHGLRSSNQNRIFELVDRAPLGPTFSQSFISPFNQIPEGWPPVV